MVGLLGPSGAGKSTLMSLLGGLFRPSAGKIFVDEVELSAVSEKELDTLRAHDVSLMLQGAARNLLPYCTPAENVAFAQRAARRSGVRDLPDVHEVLGTVGLAGHADAPLGSLTPGHLPARGAWRSRCPPSPGCCSPTSRPASSTTRRATRCSA